MIWAAIIIEIARQDWIDFAVLFVLQFINGFLGWHEEKNAGNAIEALKQRLAPKACVKRDNEFIIIDAKTLVIGDRIKIKLGDIVPADARLGPGFAEVDQAALTGESLAVTKFEGDEVYQGSVIKRGDLEAIVSATGKNTFFGKTSTLVASVNQRGNFQKILFKVAMFLLALASVCAIIILVVVSLKGNNFLETLGICVVLMVASIPIAMQVVSTATMAVGAHALAKRQAIVSRLASIEELAGMEILCSDKTGTLTKNILTVQQPRCIGSVTEKDVFQVAALASKRESGNQDAIDKCISEYAFSKLALNFEGWEEEDFIPFDPKIKRTEATVRSKSTGETMKCTKGAPQIVLALCNDPSIEEEVATMVQELAAGGYRTIGVARTQADGKWKMMGLIPLYDPPRDDTRETIKKARLMMVSVKMITGDQLAIAKETAKLLDLGDKIYNSEMLSEKSSPLEREMLDQVLLEADGFAEVFPEHKFAIVKMIQEKGKRCGMTGDGVNDAPALKKADVGIAVEGATDAARAAADIVLASPGLAVIIEAIYRARKCYQRIKNYMIYRIATTLQILFFFFVSMVAINPTDFPCVADQHCDRPNTFTLPVTGLVLITIFNDGTIISIAYDKVTVSKEPEKWNLTIVFIMSTMLGFLSFISAIVFLILGLKHMNRHDPDTVLHAFGLSTWNYSQLMTLVWYKVAMQGFANVFSARTDGFFFSRMPGKLMMCAVALAMVICTILTPYWVLNLSTGTGTGGGKMPQMHGASWPATVFVLVYTIICFLVFDVVKVGLYKLIKVYYDMKAPEKQLYTGQFLTDTFLVFTTGYDRQHRKSIVTRRSIAAVEESQAYKPARQEH